MEREIPSSGRFFLPPLWLAEPGVAGAPSGKETRMLEALLNLDASLLLAIQNLRLDWLDPIVAFYTQLGNAGCCGSYCPFPCCAGGLPGGRGPWR